MSEPTVTNSSSEMVEYPLKKGKDNSKWTDPEFRKQWNKEYRKQIKEGLRKVVQRGDPEKSKWKDPLYRKAYDNARKKRLTAERKEKKMNITSSEETRPNYTLEEKKLILEKMLDQVREGKEPSHPFFQLGLVVKPQLTRKITVKKSPKKNLV